MRNASPYVGNEDEQLRRKELESKKHWLVQGKDFRASFGKATTNSERNFIKNYVTADPSPPPVLHKFRDEKRDEWIGGHFKA